MAEIPTIVKRKLQAQVIGPIYAEMVEQVGEEKASAILDAAIRKAAIAEGKEFAKKAPGGVTSMADFIKLYELWTADGALEVTVHEATDKVFNFDVTRCKYAETYRRWDWARSAISCPATGTAHSAKAMTPTSSLSASKPSWAGPPAARSATAMNWVVPGGRVLL